MEPKPVQFTESQQYEVNDAISETINRMLTEGQTEIEIKYNSLAVLWSAWKALTIAAFGNWDTPGMLEIAPKIEVAINRPKKLKRA